MHDIKYYYGYILVYFGSRHLAVQVVNMFCVVHQVPVVSGWT